MVNVKSQPNRSQSLRISPWPQCRGVVRKLVLPHKYRTLAGRPGGRDGIPAKYENRTTTAPQLFDLRADVGETNDVAAAYPAETKRLLAFAEKCRAELGDSLTQRKGAGNREPGRIPGEVPARRKKR